VSIGIGDVDRAERATVIDVGALDVVGLEVVAPRLLLLLGVDAESEMVRDAAPHLPGRELRVLHEAQVRPVAGAEPHVAGVGIVVGRRVVDDRQPEPVAIERDRLLEVGADRRHVVQPAQLHALLIRHAAEG
jgi:hypothetical protein